MIITDKAQIKVAELRESNNLRLSESDELECYELIESDLKLPADATFTRSSVAYLSDGTQVPANIPRFEQGRFGKAVMIEEGTMNAFPNSKSFEECSGQHVGDPTKQNSVRTYLGGGWYGATHYNSATIKISEDGGLFGNKRLSFVHDGSTGWKGATSTWSIVAGKTYTVTVWARANQASAKSFNPGYAFHNQNSGQRYPFTWPDGYPTQKPGRWVRGVCTFTATVDDTGTMYLYGLDEGESGLIIDYDGVQVEEKPYATSFIDGTRADEKLTIPIEVLNHNAFTFEMWIKQSIVTTSAFSHGTRLLDLGQGLWLWNFSPAWPDPEGKNRRIIAEFGQDASGTRQYLDLVSQTPFSTVNFEYFAVTFDGATFRFFRNGVLWNSRTPSKINPFTQIVLGNAGWIIDDLRISSRARTAEEIAAAYASGQPLPVDEWTTYKLDFDDKVRITTQGQIICNELIEI